MVILMTFVATLDIYGIASRNFILVSLRVETQDIMQPSFLGPFDVVGPRHLPTMHMP